MAMENDPDRRSPVLCCAAQNCCILYLSYGMVRKTILFQLWVDIIIQYYEAYLRNEYSVIFSTPGISPTLVDVYQSIQLVHAFARVRGEMCTCGQLRVMCVCT